MEWGRVAITLGFAGCLAACAVAEKAAAKDPAMCERDPNCSRGRSSYQDCSRQCVDDPACVERCQTVQHGVDATTGGGR